MVSSVQALLLDGVSALEREVTLGWSETALTLREADGREDAIAWGNLYRTGTQPGTLVLGHHERPGWRLHVRETAPEDLLALLPGAEKYGGFIDRIGLGKAIAGFAVASALVLAAVLTAPSWLGPMVPESWERVMGDAMVGDFERYACRTPEADAALARLTRQLDPAVVPVDIYIANIGIPNAVALPGGKVLIFDGLIAGAASADELAGVIGHEIGHVRERHVMQALLRQFGLSILLSGANSGMVGDTMGGLASMSYSRDAESAADAYSRARLEQANISPAGTAGFFARMRKFDSSGENAVLGYLASHPSSARREREFNAAVEKGHAYTPALTDEEFAALREACEKDEEVEEFRLF